MKGTQIRSALLREFNGPSHWDLEATASAQGESYYVDPATGYRVFTGYGHRKRGQCCGNLCRHCPFAHEAVPLLQRLAGATQPCWLKAPPTERNTPIELLEQPSHALQNALPRPAQGWLIVRDDPDIGEFGAEAAAALTKVAESPAPILLVPVAAQRTLMEALEAAAALMQSGDRWLLSPERLSENPELPERMAQHQVFCRVTHQSD